MSGILTHGHKTFSNASGGSTSLFTVPAGSYGVNPTLIVFGGGTAGDGSIAGGGWGAYHVASIVLNSPALTITLPTHFGRGYIEASSGGVPVQGGTGWFKTIPTGELDGGGTVNIKTLTSTAGGEKSVAIVGVVTYDTADARDGTDSFTWVGRAGGAGAIDGLANPETGSFDPTPVLGDSTTVLAVGLIGKAVASVTSGPGSFAGAANWTDIDSVAVTPDGNTTGDAVLAVWRKPSPLDTSFDITYAYNSFSNGILGVLVLNNGPTGRSYGTIIGD